MTSMRHPPRSHVISDTFTPRHNQICPKYLPSPQKKTFDKGHPWGDILCLLNGIAHLLNTSIRPGLWNL